MTNENTKKKEPWRIVVGVLAISWIIYTWIEKDIAEIYATMPEEQVLPLVVTTVVVSLLKVAALTGIILLIKWLIGKFKKD